MLQWTGERFLPWIKDPALAYEHIHRYAFAISLVHGKSVLDLASGEGYGAYFLSAVAQRVIGVDIDDSAIQHARNKYQRDNLQFISSSVTQVPLTESHSFDAVTCFETIEHIENQDELLTEIKRLLKPDGILIVSTPNKTAYDEETLDENPFHLKELDFPDFQTLIGKYFRHSRYLGQRIFAGSSLWSADAPHGTVREYVMKRDHAEFQLTEGNGRVPLYYLAVASDVALPSVAPGSVLIDSGNELLLGKDRELADTKRESEAGIAWQAEQLAERDKAIEWQLNHIRSQNQGIVSLRRIIDDQQTMIDSQNEALAWRAQQVDGLQSGMAELQLKLGESMWTLETMRASPGWKLVLRLRGLKNKFFPSGSLRHKALHRIIRLVGAR